MDVQEQISKRMADYLTSEKFEEKMQSTVEGCVNDVLKSLFSYGEMHKAIENMFKEKLAININQIDFPHVNQIITDMVKEKTLHAFQEPLREKLAKELSDMFQPAPKEAKVQDIIDMYREDLRDECGCADPEDYIDVLIEPETYGYTIKLWHGDRSEKKGIYGDRQKTPLAHLYINKDTKRLSLIHDMNTRQTLGTNFFDNQAKLFLMYCAGTVIADIDTVDIQYGLETRINTHLDY